jgi:hypothetical protein
MDPFFLRKLITLDFKFMQSSGYSEKVRTEMNLAPNSVCILNIKRYLNLF